MGFKNLNPLLLSIVALAAAGGGSYFILLHKPSYKPVIPQNQSPVENLKTTLPATSPTSPILKNSQKSGISGKATAHWCNGAFMADPPPDYQPCGSGPLSSFALKITDNSSGTQRKAVTDRSGNFTIDLPPGKYTITAANENQGMMGGPFEAEVRTETFTHIELIFEEMRA